MRRVMAFFHMLGQKHVWGCESGTKQCRDARTAITRLYESMICPPWIEGTMFNFVHALVTEVPALPQGASILYLFWEGMNDSAKERIGVLAKACPTLRMVCLIQHGTPDIARTLVDKWGFPEMECVKKRTVAYAKEKFQGYILIKK